jgi:glycosyltransferase involved in cell wall biosynthesis
MRWITAGRQVVTTRILAISHNYIRFPGDHAGLFVHTLNRGLVDTGCEVTVVAPHDPGSKKIECMDDIRVRRFRYGPDRMETIAYRGTMHELVRESVKAMLLFAAFMIAFLTAITVEALRNRPHLMHAHWWFPAGFLAWLVSLVSGIPYVITVHGTDAQLAGRSPLFSNLCRRVLSRARAVMVSSDYLRSTLTASLSPKRTGQLRLFKVPVPVEPFHDRESAAKGDRRPNSILTVGRLTEQKNIGVLVDALVILKEEGIPFEALIVGDGPQRNEIERRIAEGGIADRVTLKLSSGRRELAEHFAECGVFVLPSVREGLGLVLAEALLMERPVVASKNGGSTEIVEDGVTGLLFDPGDPHDLAEALERLIRDRGFAEKLALEGRERVRSRFSATGVARRQAEIYRTVLGTGSGDARGEPAGPGKGVS